MSKPHDKLKGGSHPAQIKTMFAVEGNPNVSLVIQEYGGMRAEPMRFPDLDKAFSYCRKHRCNFVYNPAPPNN